MKLPNVVFSEKDCLSKIENNELDYSDKRYFRYLEKKYIRQLDKKLDILDNKLLYLIKHRTNLVKEVLKLKEFKKEIVDKKRINFILKKIDKKSKKLKIDSKITNRIWKNMIWSYINFERRNFKKK